MEPSENSLRTATEVVLVGQSAGGLGLLMGIDAVTRIITETARKYHNLKVHVRGLSDGGFFPNYSSAAVATSVGAWDAVTAKTTQLHGGAKNLDYASCMRDLFEFMNLTNGVNRKCVRAERAKPHDGTVFSAESNCVFAKNLVPHLHTPLFLLHHQYDAWHRDFIFSQKFPAENGVAMFSKYARDSVADIEWSFFGGHGHVGVGHGVHIDSCATHTAHCWGGGTENAGGTGSRMNWNQAETFSAWYNHSLHTPFHSAMVKHAAIVPGVNWFFQDQPYLCESCCTCPAIVV